MSQNLSQSRKSKRLNVLLISLIVMAAESLTQLSLKMPLSVLALLLPTNLSTISSTISIQKMLEDLPLQLSWSWQLENLVKLIPRMRFMVFSSHSMWTKGYNSYDLGKNQRPRVPANRWRAGRASEQWWSQQDLRESRFKQHRIHHSWWFLCSDEPPDTLWMTVIISCIIIFTGLYSSLIDFLSIILASAIALMVVGILCSVYRRNCQPIRHCPRISSCTRQRWRDPTSHKAGNRRRRDRLILCWSDGYEHWTVHFFQR